VEIRDRRQTLSLILELVSGAEIFQLIESLCGSALTQIRHCIAKLFNLLSNDL
jgi:hypothetical protein